ncbi:MAG: S8 family serine peptidase [Acidobacteria bacterium]|nr:S8 family serine peptidase [Acidobacteriota bacterium]
MQLAIEQQSLSVEDSSARMSVIISLPRPQSNAAMVGDAMTGEAAMTLITEDQKNEVRQKIKGLGGKLKRSFSALGMVAADMPLARLAELSADPAIDYISPDRAVASASNGHLETEEGALNIRALVQGTTVDGRGIGVAILDSGIDQNHNLLKPSTGHAGVVYRKDFTGTGTVNDPYGHGTHVASIVAGSATVGNGAYRGIAPNASLLDLTVLDQNGQGTTCNVMAAINWCITNKAAYNIRVINLSLGTSPKDDHFHDPLCSAVYSAFTNGIVVVASAGNLGKDAQGRKVYGGINSPAIDPTVITVGALNTFGTDARSDNVVTTYSSRGPTRSYSVDIYGRRKYENYIKPDLVAAGNRIIGARSNGKIGGGNNILSIAPTLATGSYQNISDKLMYLSGTSMAAPIVTGAVVLMLQVNPSLTPNLVKTILCYTAQTLNGANTLEQGAGQVNIDGAVRIAKLMRTDLANLYYGDALLIGALPSPQASTISNQTAVWGQGVITNYCFLYGSALITKWQPVYANANEMDWVTWYQNSQLYYNPNLITSGVSINSGALTHSFSTYLATGQVFASGVVLGEGVVLSDGTVLGDGVVLGEGVILSDGVVLGDGKIRVSASFYGDDTAAMQPVP